MLKNFFQLNTYLHSDEFQKKSNLWHDYNLFALTFSPSDENQTLNSLRFIMHENLIKLILHLCRKYFGYQPDVSSSLYFGVLDIFMVFPDKGRVIRRGRLYAGNSWLERQQRLAFYNSINTFQASRCTRLPLVNLVPPLVDEERPITINFTGRS